jgi:hypothetical protein
MENLPERLSDLQPGRDYLDPKYYLPECVPDHLGRLEFLKACERLNIPHEKWPTFDGQPILLPGWPEQLSGSPSPSTKSMGFGVRPLVFQLPPFDIFEDDHRTWKRKTERAWREFRKRQFGPYLMKCTKLRKQLASQGFLRPRKQVRLSGEKRNDTLPLELRYELAVRRYCLGESWSDLWHPHKSLYRFDQIRKAVTGILRSLGLPSGHKDT